MIKQNVSLLYCEECDMLQYIYSMVEVAAGIVIALKRDKNHGINVTHNKHITVVDLGEGHRVSRSTLIFGKKEEITEGRKAGRTSKTKLLPTPLPPSSSAEGLDPPLYNDHKK